MSTGEALLVCLGAALGAPARYLVDRAVQARHRTRLPVGTWTVNVVGSLVLGLVVGLARDGTASDAVVLAVGTGFCGAFTTYSTFAHDTHRLLEGRAWGAAALTTAATLVVGLGAAALGLAIGVGLT